MDRVLVLGSSHVAAYKLAYDALGSRLPRACEFYCALGADLAFTEVVDGKLVPKAGASMTRQELGFFFPEVMGSPAEARYLAGREPLKDVGLQFEITGGRRAIDLTGIGAIFYAAGTSPYDFRRFERHLAPYSAAMARDLLNLVIGEGFLLRAQVRAIRAAAPQIRHYFLGIPPRGLAPLSMPDQTRAFVASNRQRLAGAARDFLFDDVYMPGPSVLAEDLMSVRPEFFSGGLQQAQEFQGVEKAGADHVHANSRYAEAVFDEFIAPRLA